MAVVLIVSRTRMQNGVCVGGIIESTCELIRLHNERGGNLTSDAPYEIGDRWEMIVERAWNVRNIPHIEDKQTTPIKKINNIGIAGVIEFIKSHEFGKRLTNGRLHDTFEGLLNLTGTRNYINRDNIPSFSTQFWISDRDLIRRNSYDNHYYHYDNIRLKFVGYQTHIDKIPAGTIIRLSLANWWDGDGSGEDRCYLQLSGWYLDNKTNKNVTMDQNICLCYTEDKGLFTQNHHTSKDAIFVTYDDTGYKTTLIELPEDDIKIRIKSNFKYGRSSYLYAEIESNDNQWLDFTPEQLYVLNNSSVTRFSVPSEDWVALLLKIVNAYNTYKMNRWLNQAIEYVDSLAHLLEIDAVEIKGCFHDKRTHLWEGNFIISLHVGDKLRDLLDGLNVANIEEEVLTEHILSVCRLYLKNLKQLEIDPKDSRTIRLARTLYYICDYMNTHDAEIDFLQSFLMDGDYDS